VPKKYRVPLTPEERAELQQRINRGQGAARTLTHARILLKADASEGGPAWTDATIAQALDVSEPTIARVRQRFVEESLDAALHRRLPRIPTPCKLDGHQEAHLIALACSEAPEGRAKWSLRLLAEKMVEFGHVESLSHELVRRTLKKHPQAAPEAAVVHPAQAERRVRLADGGDPVGLYLGVQSKVAGGLHGRDEQATGRRDAHPAARRAGAARPLRLRV
jgi:transposase